MVLSSTTTTTGSDAASQTREKQRPEPGVAAAKNPPAVPRSSVAPPTMAIPAWREAVAGAFAGALSRTAMAPVERIKLLKQLQNNNNNNNMNNATTASAKYPNTTTTNQSPWALARTVYREQGIQSFWRGNLPAVLRTAGTSAINFTCLDYYKRAMVGPLLLNHNNNNTQDERTRRLLASLLSGGLAGATSTTLMYPMEFVRTRMAVDMGASEAAAAAGAAASSSSSSSNRTVSSRTHQQRQYTGMMDVVRQIVATDGWRGLYQGYGVALFGGIIFRILYLGGYDGLKTELLLRRRRRRLQQSTAAAPREGENTNNNNRTNHNDTLTWMERVAVAQTISLTAGTLSYPFDSVRRRMMMQAGLPPGQRHYRNSIECVMVVWRREGLAGFYLGLGPNLIRSVGGALVLVAYDVFRTML